MSERDGFKTSGKALAHASLHEQWRRAKQNDVQGQVLGTVVIPEAFYDVGPTRNLLYLIENQYVSIWRISSRGTRALPDID